MLKKVLKKLLKSAVSSRKYHRGSYSSDDHRKRYDRYGRHQYGHQYYRRKRSSSS